MFSLTAPCAQRAAATLDGIIDTVSATHDLEVLLALLKVCGGGGGGGGGGGAHTAAPPWRPHLLRRGRWPLSFSIDPKDAHIAAHPPLHCAAQTDTTYVCVGAPSVPPPMPTMTLLFRRLRVSGSLIGGVAETQEMLDFCGQHGITCLSEVIPASRINEAYERTLKSDVRYRFVIDVQGSIVSA